MTQITEDYISFQIAKLLKDKGFDEIKCNTCYKWNGNFCNNRRSMSGVDNEICYQAPTLQMAMKWLRKEHRIFLNVSYIPEHFAFTYRVISPSGEKKFVTYVDTYEEACEAAIKYCLENLI